MRGSRLLGLASWIVAMGAYALTLPPPAGAVDAGGQLCYICVTPPIQCIEASEWDDACQEPCGAGSIAQACPASGAECPENEAVVYCE